MNAAQRLRATYEFKPVDHLVRREFYIWEEALARWRSEGMPALYRDAQRPRQDGEVTPAELFGFDPDGNHFIHRLGWCEPAFAPEPPADTVLDEHDEYQIVRDRALRTVKVYKGRRHGFMPTYLNHAVTCDRDWHETVEPLLAADAPGRHDTLPRDIEQAKAAQALGVRIVQRCIGGYMYLRALVGPEEICYLFVDNPSLIHKMMRAWLALLEDLTARVQAAGVQYDEMFLAEDICYNHGLLISPAMVREFLLPYYQQALAGIRKRQGAARRVYFQLDTDGNVAQALGLYRRAGMDVMSPFEIAAGNDVLEIARAYPDLVMSGGIDKRMLAAGPEAIDDYLRRIMPALVRRGGYTPTCDHGVPDNVSFANYMHYRRRVMEMDH